MRHPALVIGWELLRRHPWPLIALVGYMVVLAAIKILGLGPVERITIVPPDGRAAVLIAPLSTGLIYYFAVFSFGFAGDLAGRASIFPARMFALPVRTATLVSGPMLAGVGTVALLVLVATLLAHWPWGIDAPLLWPALLAAVFLAWMQALMWMPYGLRGIRVVVTVLWLALLDAIIILAAHYELPEPLMLAILAPQVPLAYLVAHRAVARARRGEVPDWAPPFARFFRRTAAVPRGRPWFRSAARAQAWIEWRRHGRTLPALVAMVLPLELALLWLARDAWGLVLEIVVIVLATPLLLASVAPATMSRSNPDARDASGLTPFTATRPLSSAALVGARLATAAWSTLGAWLLVLALTLPALGWSGTWPLVAERASRLAAVVGTPRAIAFALLLLMALMGATWKQLVQGLYLGLTGRAWIIRTAVIAALAFLVGLLPALDWLAGDKGAQARLWSALPSLLGVLVALKLLAAALVAVPLTRSGLLGDRVLVTGAVGWVVAVLALYGVLGWLVAGPLIPRYLLLLGAILAVPLVRVSAAPLALAWNRHR